MWKEVKQGLLETIWATGQTLTCAQPTHKYLHTHFTTIRDTQHSTSSLHSSVHPPSWPVCSTNTHWSHTSLYECAKEHTRTHEHAHTVGASSVCPQNWACWNRIISFSALSWFAAHRRRRAGRVSPNALKIGLPQSVSWGLKYKSVLPPVSWSWPFSQGPAGKAVCGIEKKKTGKTTSKRKNNARPPHFHWDPPHSHQCVISVTILLFNVVEACLCFMSAWESLGG